MDLGSNYFLFHHQMYNTELNPCLENLSSVLMLEHD